MRRRIKMLALVLALTVLAACGTSAKPSEAAFEAACESAGAKGFQREENGLAADGNDWTAQYQHCSSSETARAVFQGAVDDANRSVADAGAVTSYSGGYQTFVKETARQFLYIAQVRDIYIFAQGTPAREQTIRDLMAALGFEGD